MLKFSTLEALVFFWISYVLLCHGLSCLIRIFVIFCFPGISCFFPHGFLSNCLKFAPNVAGKSQGLICNAVKEHTLQELQKMLRNDEDIADDLRKGKDMGNQRHKTTMEDCS